MSDVDRTVPTFGRRASGLGRGLDALLGEAGAVSANALSPRRDGGIERIAVTDIHPHPGQPRRHFDDDAIAELAASIALRGVIQPIIVRAHPDHGGYQLIAGERRWRAAQRAGLHVIPAIVRSFEDSETLEIALVENIQREDLNAIEEARAYRKLSDEFGHSQDVLARLVGKSRSHVANLMRLLDLPDAVQDAVVAQRISMGHARALIGADDAVAIAEQVAREGLSVRQVEQLVRQKSPNGKRHVERPAPAADSDLHALERQLSDLLGLKVAIDHRGPAGIVSLSYSSLDQLDMICQRLSGERI